MSKTQGPGLFFQNENMNIHNEGPVLKKTNSSISKTSQKKVGGNRRALQDLSNSGLLFENQNLENRKEGSYVKKISDSISKTSQKKVGGNRKPLQNLSNSISVRKDAAGKKKNPSIVADERFLHNPNRCTTARKAELDRNIHDAVLLEHGLLDPDRSLLRKETELAASCFSPPKYLQLEPVPELPTSANTDRCPSSVQLESPSPSVSLYKLPELKAELTDTYHDVLEEGFLHDHSKCTEAHRAQTDRDIYNAVLIEHGLPHSEASLEEKDTMVSYKSPPRYLKLDEIPELSMSTMADLCFSPNRLDSPPPFSSSWYKMPELMLNTCIEG